MINLVSLVCPACGASFAIQEGQKQCFCAYCGTQILVDDGSKTYTYVHKTVDEARIREADLTELLELKRMEAGEKKRQNKRKTAKTVALIGAILLGAGVLLYAVDPLFKASTWGTGLLMGVYGFLLLCIALCLYCSASFGKE